MVRNERKLHRLGSCEKIWITFLTRRVPVASLPTRVSVVGFPPLLPETLALLLSDLGVNKSHSRPYVSDDNSFSEAQFKTLRYHPDYPDRFGCIQDAWGWAQPFFEWYNHQHYHAGLNLLIPASVHYGQAEAIRRQRQAVLTTA